MAGCNKKASSWVVFDGEDRGLKQEVQKLDGRYRGMGHDIGGFYFQHEALLKYQKKVFL